MRTVLAATAAVLTVLAVVAALQRLTPPEPSRSMDSLRAIEPRSAEARAACSSLVLGQMVEAMNSGDGATLADLFGDAATPVHSFKVSGPLIEIDETDGLRAAERLLMRSAAGERWRIERVTADTGPSWHGAVDVRIVLTREAPDLPSGAVTASGDGVVSCVSGKVASLRLATA